MAAREELQGVGALKKLRTELEARRKLLEAQLLEEVKVRLYAAAQVDSGLFQEVLAGSDDVMTQMMHGRPHANAASRKGKANWLAASCISRGCIAAQYCVLQCVAVLVDAEKSFGPSCMASVHSKLAFKGSRLGVESPRWLCRCWRWYCAALHLQRYVVPLLIAALAQCSVDALQRCLVPKFVHST